MERTQSEHAATWHPGECTLRQQKDASHRAAGSGIVEFVKVIGMQADLSVEKLGVVVEAQPGGDTSPRQGPRQG